MLDMWWYKPKKMLRPIQHEKYMHYCDMNKGMINPKERYQWYLQI